MIKLVKKVRTSNKFILKYEIRNLQLITQAKIRKQHWINLEQELKIIENNLTSEENRKR